MDKVATPHPLQIPSSPAITGTPAGWQTLLTSSALAAAVLSGRADAGLGVRAAANALGLEFMPVGVEEYDLVIPVRYARDERIIALFEVIRSEDFKSAVQAMGGYGTAQTGEILWEYDGN